MRRIERLVAAAAMLLAPSSAFAACTASVTAVSFGTYDTLLPAPDDSTGTVNVDCNAGERSIVATIGAGSSGSIAARTMLSGGAPLNYNLYTTAARNIIWGDGITGASVTLTFVNSAGGVRHYNGTIYGRIPALQSVNAGTYTDIVIVTITY